GRAAFDLVVNENHRVPLQLELEAERQEGYEVIPDPAQRFRISAVADEDVVLVAHSRLRQEHCGAHRKNKLRFRLKPELLQLPRRSFMPEKELYVNFTGCFLILDESRLCGLYARCIANVKNLARKSIGLP